MRAVSIQSIHILSRPSKLIICLRVHNFSNQWLIYPTDLQDLQPSSLSFRLDSHLRSKIYPWASNLQSDHFRQASPPSTLVSKPPRIHIPWTLFLGWATHYWIRRDLQESRQGLPKTEIKEALAIRQSVPNYSKLAWGPCLPASSSRNQRENNADRDQEHICQPSPHQQVPCQDGRAVLQG